MIIGSKFNGYSADNRRLYFMDGGGSPEKSTQVTDLPDWAKPYAKETLQRTQALSQKPYQEYGGERIAGFAPMQLQAQEAASKMGTSGQLGTATGLASAAGLSALGTQYGPGQFYGGTFGGRQAAQYMSPFIEQAMAPQLREAQRTAAIQGTQLAGQAVKSGAFGGSRAGLLEAEAQRNLNTQMGDIRARGYQTAFEQAQQQFNQDMARRMQAQQLGEQSRQFGAGLGLQGLQTGLQAAGQLGTLGQAEFGQQKDIIGLQSQLGAQQQALRQQGLSQAYQDFLNRQNYDYRQLGFMSDMIRGMPLGQQSTAMVYPGSGNTMGQLAGIGMGIYGLSQSPFFGGSSGTGKAEGGMVDSYADGGVTDDQFVESTLTKLSDAQLAQAKQAALNARDMDRVAMIDSEMAERASIRSGLGGAFNMLPQENQDSVTEMAGGGIVAFADGGPTPEEIEAASRPYIGRPMIVRPRDKQYEDINLGERFLNFLIPPYKEPPKPAAEAPKAEPPKRAAPPRPSAPSAPKADTRTAPPKAAGKDEAGILPAIETLARQTGESVDTLLANHKKLEEHFSSQRKEDMKSLTDIITSQLGDSKKIQSEALPAALAAFGFRWAQAASKPGARFLGSAAEAAPVLGEVAAESRRAAREADKADMQLKLTLRQFEIAQRNGDQRMAATLAAQAETLKANRDRLNLMAQEIRQRGELARAQLGQRASQFERTLGVQEKALGVRSLAAAAQFQRLRNDALKQWEAGPARTISRSLEQKYGKNWKDQPGPQAEFNRAKNDFVGERTAGIGGGSRTAANPLSSYLSQDELAEIPGLSTDED